MSAQHSYAELESFVLARWPHVGASNGGMNHDAMPGISFGEFLGVERNSLFRAQRAGFLSTEMADKVAVKGLGVHPQEVWSDWYASAADEPQCAWCREICGWDFTYCSRPHKDRALAQRKSDAKRLAKWWGRVDAVSSRVARMTPAELDAFLGIPSSSPAVEEAA